MPTPDRERIMAALVPATGPIPTLTANASETPAGCCTSCGDALLDGARPGARCEPCIAAAWAALAWGAPPPPLVQQVRPPQTGQAEQRFGW